ncbi:MAG: aldehyde-activating protein [SAR86 cluster bacterium]|uniref:Aldehyde-activating protein n=1 Tax=SAR86 cluster bacterium TaxID=2030880 RepID=A0A2A5B7D0_9GAMM|nr:MAG: aldehyde-activating protein [SAR86 cluster bacterium]
MKYAGGCHCGAVRFEVEVTESVEVERCNCSICKMSGNLHLILPKSRFQLLSSESAIQTYTFNTGVAQHYFCKVCGIKSFYIPRSNPDGVDVNVHCLDTLPANMEIVDFDGENWEKNAYKLAHKSKQP